MKLFTKKSALLGEILRLNHLAKCHREVIANLRKKVDDLENDVVPGGDMHGKKMVLIFTCNKESETVDERSILLDTFYGDIKLGILDDMRGIKGQADLSITIGKQTSEGNEEDEVTKELFSLNKRYKVTIELMP